jgi:outer membrane biosynthesis protein TonB
MKPTSNAAAVDKVVPTAAWDIGCAVAATEALADEEGMLLAAAGKELLGPFDRLADGKTKELLASMLADESVGVRLSGGVLDDAPPPRPLSVPELEPEPEPQPVSEPDPELEPDPEPEPEPEPELPIEQVSDPGVQYVPSGQQPPSESVQSEDPAGQVSIVCLFSNPAKSCFNGTRDTEISSERGFNADRSKEPSAALTTVAAARTSIAAAVSLTMRVELVDFSDMWNDS